MVLRVAVPKETTRGERRVALTPEVVRKLTKDGLSVVVESGAGTAAFYPDDLYRAAAYVLSQNLVHGNALTIRTHDGQPITFAEWGYLGKGKFQRRDFCFATLTQSSALSAQGSLFA